MKKSAKQVESTETVEETTTNNEIVESTTPVEVTVSVTTPVEKKAPGRPINATSVRQMKLAAKKDNPGKKGRPVVPGSKRQIREADLKAKREAGLLKRGRPKMDPIELAKRKAERAVKAAEAAQAAVTAQ